MVILGDASRGSQRWREEELNQGDLSALQRHAFEQRKRHAEPQWYEWTLREFLRYWYFFGTLAVIVFVPLQIAEAWLPWGAPPVVDPLLADLAMAASGVAVLVAAAFGYLLLWKKDGWIDRAVERHAERLAESSR